MQEALFISDLHLNEENPAITQLFLTFVEQRAVKADALYILGDFFDAWIGDDEDSALSRACIQALKKLTVHTRVFFMVGNRDFLIGQDFAQAVGLTLLDDPYQFDLFGTPTLLLHGDLLCSDDVQYQQARTMLRSRVWQTDFLSKDIALRRQLAAQYRQASGEHTAMEAADIMDTNQQTVEQTMQQHGAYQMIHGHTHRPDIHYFMVNGCNATRYVLAQWHETGSVLCWTVQGPHIETIIC